MVGVAVRHRPGMLVVASLVLGVLGGLWSGIGAWIPGGFVALIAAVLGFIGLRRARVDHAPAGAAMVGLTLSALVVIASVALLIANPPS